MSRAPASPYRLTGLAVAAAALGAGTVSARSPEAGTAIENTASVSYFNTSIGLNETVSSNTVYSVVNAVEDFTVTEDQSYIRTPGENIQFAFEVINTGNTDTSVNMDFGDLAGTFDFSILTAVLDLNNNGQADAGEPEVQSGMAVDLPYGARVSVLIDAGIPDTADTGDVASGVLTASLATGGMSQSSTGEVRIVEQAMDLRKSVAAADTGELIYTLTLRNNSATEITPENMFDGGPMLLDGAPETLIVVRDAIPLNTQFSRVIEAVNFEAVYHATGDAENIWTRKAPSDPADIDALAFVSDDSFPAGEGRDFKFAVNVTGQASELAIKNTAEVLQPDGQGSFLSNKSNNVSTVINGPAGEITFFNDAFDSEQGSAGFGDSLFLQVDSGACNITADIDQAVVTLTTTDGDSEQIIAVETAPNSGRFRTAGLPIEKAPPVLVGDGTLQGAARSIVSASVDCDSAAREALTLSPAGAVFLSATNEPVPGAQVDLLDASGAVIATTVTDAEGMFEVAPTAMGVHSIRVTPPAGLVAPSARISFPGFGRFVDPSASYGAEFSVTNTGNLSYDIPVDPDMTGALIADKSANRTTARIGELIQYTVDIRNTSPIAIQNAEIADQLPPGVSFVPGTAVLNGAALSDPAGNARMVFPVGILGPNSEATLVYSATVNATAGEGDATNLAFATGSMVGLGQPIQSNIASHTVKIDNDGGVFSRDGVILGKVFMDCDSDGKQSGDEPGIPGIMLHTQQGLSVATDSDGRFSLPGLKPKTHVLDIYEPSLPGGTRVTSTRAMDTFVGGSRFVPLRAGEIRSEDFAVEACDADTLADVRERIESFELSGLGAMTPTAAMQLDGRGANFQIDHTRQAVGAIVDANTILQDAAPQPPKHIETTVDLSASLEAAPASTSFIDLADGDQLVQRSVSVRVAAPADLTLGLSRNGEPIAAGRIGQRLTENGKQALEYVAVQLEPGSNTLALTALDSFGNVRAENIITVTAPGKPARIELTAPKVAAADPSRPVPIAIQVVDIDGHPAASNLEVTLTPGDDRFDARDTSEQAPGQQTLLEDGRTVLNLIPAEEVGTRTIRVTSPLGDAEARIQFVANTDAADIAVGYAEAVFNLNDPSEIPGLLNEDDISLFEDTEEGAETSFYVKGEVLEDVLLTLRLETDKEIEDELFRSDEPDEFYPVYGDRSQRGFDARSRGKLFAKIERGTNYLLFGDVAYDADAQALQLGRYSRTLEGAMAHVEAGPLRLDVYAGETDTGNQVLEIPARGISGPYDLGYGEVIPNSETVELVTRDRNQPSVILKTERLGRFSAYTLDYFNHALIFTRPIPSRDEDLNPISIRVTFETENGAGEAYGVYGGEAAFDVTDYLTVGARHLTSDAPDGNADHRSVSAAYLDTFIGETGRLQIEAAVSENGLGENGTAARVSYEQQTASGSYGARLSTASEDFDAPGASATGGREEARIFANTRLGKTGLLSGEAIYSASKTSDQERLGVVGRYEQAITDTLRLRAGSRYVNDDSGSGTEAQNALTIIGGLNWTPGFLNGANLDLEAEQEVTSGAANRFALGADYALTPSWRVYAQGEYSGSRSGGFGLADQFNSDITFRAGSEYRLPGNINAFSEYRANETLFDAGVAQGLTTSWALSPALNVRARVEHVQPISDTFRRNTAAGIGATWEPEENNWILDGDLEYGAGENGRQSWYASTTYGRRWEDVTLLIRNRLATSAGAGETRTRDRLRMGWAHRPVRDDALNTLAWYEFEVDDQPELRETRHIWSAGGERKPDAKLRLRGRIAGQYYSNVSPVGLLDYDEVTLLAQAGLDRDIGKRWNLGANVSAITDGRFENQTVGLGGEANMVIRKGAMVGVGYNYAEVDRESLEGLYRTGFFIRLRMKFDQSVWNIFDRDN